MKTIKKLVDMIDDELESAECYAEKYLEYTADGKDNHFKEMAEDELNHAMWLHDIAMDKIEKLSRVFTAPMDMRTKWDEAHKEYIDVVSEIKRMLMI